MNSKLIGLLKSRKFWASLLGLVFVCLPLFGVKLESLPFTQDQVLNVVVIVVGYVLSVAVEDGLAGRK